MRLYATDWQPTARESTRYCNYAKADEITVIKPFFFDEEYEDAKWDAWRKAMRTTEACYLRMIELGASPQGSPLSSPKLLKTEIVVTYNLRGGGHFFNLRAAKAAHPQMQQLAIPLLLYFKKNLRPLFDDIGFNENFDCNKYAEIIILGGDI